MEIEIKLGPLTRRQAEDIFCDTARMPALNQVQAIPMETTYYDTPAGDFARGKQTLRLRKENDVRVCTFKTALKGLSRLELECQADTIEEGAALLAQNPAMPEDARQALLGGAFVPVCGARFLRQTRRCLVESTQFDLCADIGVLFKGDATQELCEIELELVSGDADILQMTAGLLTAAYGAEICTTSKQQRAMALGGSAL